MWWSGNDSAAVNCAHEHVQRPLLRCNCPGTNLGHRHGFALHDTILKWVTHLQLVSKRASCCHPSLWPPARDGCIYSNVRLCTNTNAVRRMRQKATRLRKRQEKWRMIKCLSKWLRVDANDCKWNSNELKMCERYPWICLLLDDSVSMSWMEWYLVLFWQLIWFCFFFFNEKL